MKRGVIEGVNPMKIKIIINSINPLSSIVEEIFIFYFPYFVHYTPSKGEFKELI